MAVTTLTYTQINSLRRRVPKVVKDLRKAAAMLAEIKLLRAIYESEVVTLIHPEPAPMPLAFWVQYFRLRPEFYTPHARARIAYARETKVQVEISAPLAELKGASR